MAAWHLQSPVQQVEINSAGGEEENIYQSLS
jgi:hypothetical protein